jgi:hypothetical protein
VRASCGSGPRSWWKRRNGACPVRRAGMRCSPAGVRWHLDGFSLMSDRRQAPGGRVDRRRMEVNCGG